MGELSFSQYRTLLQGRAEHDRDIALDLVSREVEALDSLAESVEVEENATLLAYLRIYKRRSRRSPHHRKIKASASSSDASPPDPMEWKQNGRSWSLQRCSMAMGICFSNGNADGVTVNNFLSGLWSLIDD